MTPFLLLLLAVLQVSQAKTENPARLERKAGQKALGVWGSTLSPDDYNASLWQQWWSQPQNFFEHYAHKLSGIYAGEGAKVNFVLVGACDGKPPPLSSAPACPAVCVPSGPCVRVVLCGGCPLW